jgi:hypothetical protein
VPSLRLAPSLASRVVVTAIGAIDVAVITKGTEVEETTALVTNALDLP